MENKKVIWALYDDGNMSWYNCGYDKNKFRIISIGIQHHPTLDDYHRIDLSITNNNLIKQLSKLPKPDIIVASPPCESWSIADNQQRLFRYISICGEIEYIALYSKTTIELNNLTFHKNFKRCYFKQLRTCLNGIITVSAVEYIIDYFKPETWIIENPMTSKIWEWIKLRSVIQSLKYENKTNYNCYDYEFTKKPTIFMSNKKIDLKYYTVKSSKTWEKIIGYDKRSSIPKTLLLDILSKI